MTVVAAFGYPRDLLDRGRVNIRIARDGDETFVVHDRQLVAAAFTTPAVEPRRSVIPANGQVVALQTLLGEVVDCERTVAVSAEFRFSYTMADDPSPRSATVPLDDATVLDDVRAQQCTERLVLEHNDVELRSPVVDDESMRVDLVVRRRAGDERLSFDAIAGTVLIGAETALESGSPGRVLEPDEAEIVIPLALDVNRCDPHAIGETTRKFGLGMYIAVDGHTPRLVAVPVEPVVPQLETMLERCMARTGG